MAGNLDWVLDRRLRAQRLSSEPFRSAADVVRLLTCVQAQERDHAFFSLGLRTAGATLRSVRDSHDRGEFVRTHILRPTWHFVAKDDLRWILRLTSPRMETATATRRRQLDLDQPGLMRRAFDALAGLLENGNFMTRPEIASVFARVEGLPAAGPALGHVLLAAELCGLVCGGPIKGAHHTYALVDELIPPAPDLDRDEAVLRLVERFFTGHGPASVHDFTRWSSLTLADTRRALSASCGRLERTEVDGVELWFDPEDPPRSVKGSPRAWLLPVYDEAALTYRRLGFPPVPGHPGPTTPDLHWATVVCGYSGVGVWKRSVGRREVRIETRLDPSLDTVSRRAVEAAASRLARFVGLPLDYSTGSGERSGPHLTAKPG